MSWGRGAGVLDVEEAMKGWLLILVAGVLLAPVTGLAQDVDGATLYRAGIEAIGDEEWERAAQLLEAAYEASPAESRSRIAFSWGFAVSRHGQTILRENTDGNLARHRQGIAALERSLLILELTTDSRGAPLRETIRQYLAEAPDGPGDGA